jgi:hypothetical protein
MSETSDQTRKDAHGIDLRGAVQALLDEGLDDGELATRIRFSSDTEGWEIAA